MATIIDGKIVSQKVYEEIKQQVQELKDKKGVTPSLALLLVGENPASKVYVNSKRKACQELGFNSIVVHLPESASEKEVLDLIAKWNDDNNVHGILVQLPLPSHISEQKVIWSIRPSKDVDGFHPENLGRLVLDLPGFRPCTPAGIVELLKHYEIQTKGKHVVVVGRSNIVGKPVANMLYQKNDYANAIVTICHTATNDISHFTQQADILIVAIGRARMIKSKDVKEGAVIIDVGINRIADATSPKGYKIVGDVDFEDVIDKVSAITPVPGGVGLMTVAMLMKNTLLSACGYYKYEK